MEAEYVALSTPLRDFIPMKELIAKLLNAVGLKPSKIASIKSTQQKISESRLA